MLAAGSLALVVGTAFGWARGLLDALVAPPAIVRAALVAGSPLLGVWLLARAVGRIGAAQGAIPLRCDRTMRRRPRWPRRRERDLAALVRASASSSSPWPRSPRPAAGSSAARCRSSWRS